jgi:hypothetical protein
MLPWCDITWFTLFRLAGGASQTQRQRRGHGSRRAIFDPPGRRGKRLLGMLPPIVHLQMHQI